jgi:hypothetical protein
MSPKQITAVPAVVVDIRTSRMVSLLEVKLNMTGLILLSTVQDVLLFPINTLVGITRGSVPSRSEKFGINLYLLRYLVRIPEGTLNILTHFRRVRKAIGDKRLSASSRPSARRSTLNSWAVNRWFSKKFYAVDFNQTFVNFNLISYLRQKTVRPHYKDKLRDLKLPPLRKWDLRSSGMLRSLEC